MKKLMTLHVKGKNKEWAFDFYADKDLISEWRGDGLEVYVMENTVPVFIAELGLSKVWCFFQDILNFKNPIK